MSSSQIFILLLVAIVLAAGIYKRQLHIKASQPQPDPDRDRRLQALERRVETLERIVTDKGYDLKREFDQL